VRQVDAAKLLRVPQPKISALMNYRLDVFSVAPVNIRTAARQVLLRHGGNSGRTNRA
jgi:predicted XRE-type DNA-binding protein